MDYYYSSFYLYYRGWRSSDRDQLRLAYDLSDSDLDLICETLDILADGGVLILKPVSYDRKITVSVDELTLDRLSFISDLTGNSKSFIVRRGIQFYYDWLKKEGVSLDYPGCSDGNSQS